MNRISTWLTTLALLACSVAANATMTSIDGGALVNDSTDNLTWVADADLFATMAAASGNPANFVQTIINNSGGIIHDTPNADDYPAPNSGSYALSTSDFTPTTTRLNNAGAMTWFGAMAWVNYLNVTKYQGYSEWRLPTTIDASSSTGNPSGGAGNPPVTSSELAELFYGQLGQVTNQPILTTHNGNYSLFSNM
ncbi:MAG TPA: hypothetical protein VKG05_10420, partial [Steroidobacteraceae bacterium]|nr:hypothetical protein [Steroidobacteraceae bacterium]